MISDDSDGSVSDYELLDTDSDELMELPYDDVSTIPWSQLPPIVLEKIYSFLNRDDRCRMSQVCRNWYNEYNSPNLWRRIKFLIPEHEYQIEIYPEVQFARKYGTMFHHVDIVCKRVHIRLLEIIWKQLKLFLQALASQSQLESVSFMNMGRLLHYFRRLDDTIFEDIYESIMNLLFTQNKLQLVEFRNSQFKTYEAAEILRTICMISSKTLKHLLLDGFVNESSQDEFPENIVDEALTFQLLINLKTVLIDYSRFLENIIMSCYKYAENSNIKGIKGTLKMVKIICDGSKRITYHGIPPAAWQYFTKVCPSLRINLIYQVGSQIRNNINVFVVRHMPIRSLDFRGDKGRFRNESEIGDLLKHFVSCRVNEFLEDLRIVWPQTTTNLAPDLVEFLKVCNKLNVLQLYIQHPVEALDTVFTFLLEYRPPSLEVLHITVGNVITVEDAFIYSNMADDYYAPLLQDLGLNLLLIVDYNNRPPRRREI